MEVQVDLKPFSPSAAQAKKFREMRDHVVAHRDDYRAAATFIETHYSMKAIRQRELRSRPKGWRNSIPKGARLVRTSRRSKPWFRMCQFAADAVGRPGEQEWDLTTLSDRERSVRAHAICYVMWLMMDPDAPKRGVGLTDLESAGYEVDDFPEKGKGTAKASFELDRRWARMTVLDLNLRQREVWLRLVDTAWEEVQGVDGGDRTPVVHPTRRRKARGRPRKYDRAADEKLANDYKASAQRPEEFARARGIDADDLRGAVERVRSQRKRDKTASQAKSVAARKKVSDP